MEEIDDQLVTEILRCPEKRFPQFLFGADTLKTVELLNRLISLPNGYDIVIDCLSCWQDVIGASYCLEPVVAELQHSDNFELLYECLALINRLLLYSPNAVSKIRVQHELKELNVENRIHCLREEKHNMSATVKRQMEDQIQLWYSENVQSCNVHSQGRTSSIAESEDMNSSGESDEEVRMATVVSASPEENANDIKSVEEMSKILTDLLKRKNDSVRSHVLENMCCAVLNQFTAAEMINLLRAKFELVADALYSVVARPSPSETVTSASTPSPPPPPPPCFITPSGPPPPPPPLMARLPNLKKPELPPALKPKFLPKKGTKLKQIQWTKIPVEKVITESPECSNIWMLATTLPDENVEIDFDYLESLFSFVPVSPEESPLEKLSSKKSDSIVLLSYKRSFSVSIFLKQFKEGAEQALDCLRNGDSTGLELENLYAFFNILPEKEEIEILRNFDGNTNLLGVAEQFLLKLIALPSYRLKVECLILKHELFLFDEIFREKLDSVISACSEIRSSKILPKLLCMLVKIGNFLNANRSGGNAAGFKLNSLWRVIDIKAAKTSLTLLHFLAMQDPPCAAELADELKTVPEASKLSFETLKTDFVTIRDKVKRIMKEIGAANDEAYFARFITDFQVAEDKLEKVDAKIQQLDGLVKSLAEYFCETGNTFKVEECLKTLATFINRLQIAAKENEARQKRESGTTKTQAGLRQSASATDLDITQTPNAFTAAIEKSTGSLDRQRKKVKRHITDFEKLKCREIFGDSRTPSNEDEPVVSSNHQPRHTNDTFFIKNHNDLDDFLNAAERLEKEVWQLYAENIPLVLQAKPVEKIIVTKKLSPSSSEDLSQPATSVSPVPIMPDEGFESDKSLKSSVSPEPPNAEVAASKKLSSTPQEPSFDNRKKARQPAKPVRTKRIDDKSKPTVFQSASSVEEKKAVSKPISRVKQESFLPPSVFKSRRNYETGKLTPKVASSTSKALYKSRPKPSTSIMKYSKETRSAPRSHIVVPSLAETSRRAPPRETYHYRMEEVAPPKPAAPSVPKTPVPARPTTIQKTLSPSEIAERELAGKSPLLNASYPINESPGRRRVLDKNKLPNVSSQQPVVNSRSAKKPNLPSNLDADNRNNNSKLGVMLATNSTDSPRLDNTSREGTTPPSPIQFGNVKTTPMAKAAPRVQKSTTKVTLTTSKRLAVQNPTASPDRLNSPKTTRPLTKVDDHFLSSKKTSVVFRSSTSSTTNSLRSTIRVNKVNVTSTHSPSPSSSHKLSGKSPSFCSTTTRPSLIKTGSIMTRPDWR